MTTTYRNKIATLVARIKRRREALHMTQAQVATLAGIRQGNYSRMESGRQTPNLETLLAVMDVLNLDLQTVPTDETVYHVMYLDEPVTDVILSKDKKHIQYIKYKEDGLQQPFSGNRLDLERFYRFMKSRCYEDDRADLDLILEKAGFQDNNPYDWVALTHGVMYHDFFWVRINDERITWDEVRIR